MSVQLFYHQRNEKQLHEFHHFINPLKLHLMDHKEEKRRGSQNDPPQDRSIFH